MIIICDGSECGGEYNILQNQYFQFVICTDYSEKLREGVYFDERKFEMFEMHKAFQEGGKMGWLSARDKLMMMDHRFSETVIQNYGFHVGQHRQSLASVLGSLTTWTSLTSVTCRLIVDSGE